MKEEQESGRIEHKGKPAHEIPWIKKLAVCLKKEWKLNLKIPIEVVRKLFVGNNHQRTRGDNTEEMDKEKKLQKKMSDEKENGNLILKKYRCIWGIYQKYEREE